MYFAICIKLHIKMCKLISELGNCKPRRLGHLHMDWNMSECGGYHKMVFDEEILFFPLQHH